MRGNWGHRHLAEKHTRKENPAEAGFSRLFPCDIRIAPPSWQEIPSLSLFCPLRFLRNVHVREISGGSNLIPVAKSHHVM